MGMQKDWHDTKSMAKTACTAATGKLQLDALARHEEPPAYPFKFDRKLGPTLEKYEKAVKDKKDADKKKFADEAKKILAIYITEVRKEAPKLNKLDQRICTVLLTELQKIFNVVSK